MATQRILWWTYCKLQCNTVTESGVTIYLCSPTWACCSPPLFFQSLVFSFVSLNTVRTYFSYIWWIEKVPCVSSRNTVSLSHHLYKGWTYGSVLVGLDYTTQEAPLPPSHCLPLFFGWSSLHLSGGLSHVFCTWILMTEQICHLKFWLVLLKDCLQRLII